VAHLELIADKAEQDAKLADRRAEWFRQLQEYEDKSKRRDEDFRYQQVALLVDSISQEWTAYDPAIDDPRYHAVFCLIATFGSYQRRRSLDPELNTPRDGYEAFAGIPRLVYDLLYALDNVEFEEFS
jgi:hypothetical protein